MFAALKRRRRLRAQAGDLYGALMRQARNPGFFRDLAVPDSLDGRFDLLVLHAYLLLRRLRETDEAGRELAQAVFDTMFADMDGTLREMGVGDLSVGRKIRGMSEAFYGRVQAYDLALARGDATLAEALNRNVYTGEARAGAAAALAGYVRRADAGLAATPLSDLMAGQVRFPPAGEAAP